MLCCNSEPERPADFSVRVWGSCLWDGLPDPDLCNPALECHAGLCLRTCESDSICASVDGHAGRCFSGHCSFACEYSTAANTYECPATEGAPLQCRYEGYCGNADE